MPSRKQKEKQAAHALETFVEAVLRGNAITEDDLKKLIDLEVREGQRIEYKSEGWTDKTKDKNRKTGKGKPRSLQARVAKYMAGFANGTGGVLVVGVAEEKDGTRDNGKPERLDPIPEDRRDLVAEQVKQGLLKLKGQLPRIESACFVDASTGGFYVVVGVQRASRLVQVAEPDHLMFYLRVHDTTTYAPDYLAADLFLGRRQQPVSRAVEASASNRKLANSPSDLRPRVTFENVGLAWMEHPRAGFIGIHMGKDPGPLSPHLASEVRAFGIRYGNKDRGPLLYRAQTRMDKSLDGRVPPLDGFYVETANYLPSPHLDRQVVLWAFALYLISAYPPRS